MDIKASALLNEMQALQGEMRTPNQVNAPGLHQDFSALLSKAINNVNELQQSTDSLRGRFELGDEAVSLEQVMIAAQKSGIAFEATVQVRNKLVDAYKTIMNMPV
ncbi:flagellar hook-basal body complex protein FliE [Zobellella denitrificans]|jgi:flagellar hook-basal body complex protein FliE|uniref:Flagellar hook-basal body complex protein FliE n=1 Tax=Zobellella denitrificans TaxID=347534 RepID=A0A231MV08_9GAMM|nr:flagellar hook-basal body complex protein FliE [Zobellella denitrificans]ATG73194.1 flagellar hook-basal body protein FliE [Zobellella denitrificans]OXS14043.1 flagellar hook-basal body complex protein FliE [Zobellella denitrificans]